MIQPTSVSVNKWKAPQDEDSQKIRPRLPASLFSRGGKRNTVRYYNKNKYMSILKHKSKAYRYNGEK